ncbi:hypothetical protein TanjilG_05130 [Lupinus angustifolius]|uniref:Uncharacterized protein n=1 Tax=Lupinus angustifolius TaxID=3871 RepID=A0A1J7HAV2_LUPAN|nr:hypothetical protein TanjilG_05130 [Lupinus angustifolius]
MHQIDQDRMHQVHTGKVHQLVHHPRSGFPHQLDMSRSTMLHQVHTGKAHQLDLSQSVMMHQMHTGKVRQLDLSRSEEAMVHQTNHNHAHLSQIHHHDESHGYKVTWANYGITHHKNLKTCDVLLYDYLKGQ